MHVTGSGTPTIHVIAESNLQNLFKLFCNQTLFSACLQTTKVKGNKSNKHPKLSLVVLLLYMKAIIASLPKMICDCVVGL